MGISLKEQILDLVGRRDRIAFLFDFDGTLVDLAPNPVNLDIPSDLLRDLEVMGGDAAGDFAIITGRALAQLDAFLRGIWVPAVGNHGAECRVTPGAAAAILTPKVPAEVRDALHDAGDRHGCLFEDKVFSLALHLPFTHADDDIAPELTAALGARCDDYFIRKVGRTYEVLRRGVTKGSGIAHLMTLPGYKGRTPVYIGDDAHLDESLSAVRDRGGVLLPARHAHHAGPQGDGELLETKDVRYALSLLSQAKR